MKLESGKTTEMRYTKKATCNKSATMIKGFQNRYFQSILLYEFMLLNLVVCLARQWARVGGLGMNGNEMGISL